MSRHVFRYRVDRPLGPGAEVALDDEDSHHLARVVRRAVGDSVEVTDGDGLRWEAEVAAPGPPARVRVLAGPLAAPSVAPVRLYLGLLEWKRLDTLHAQLTELGVPEVVLFSSSRAGRLPGRQEWARRAERLDRVSEAAARQSGATPVAIRGVVAFGTVLDEVAPGGGYLLHPAARRPLTTALTGHGADTLALLVGPEAGFAASEISDARSAGVEVCGFGGRVLRAGTAALVATTAAMLALGALDPVEAG